MACRTPRKGPRRPRAKASTLDPDLATLAAVIAEYALDNNAFGWFRAPWRNGKNAIELARLAAPKAPPFSKEIDNWLHACFPEPDLDPTHYEYAGILLNEATNPFQHAALRCMQVMLAHSDGGGHVYNIPLIGAFRTIEPVLVEQLVMECRCRDAIGVGLQLQHDSNDRLRRAFKIAWERGLYLVAYSLPLAASAPSPAKLTIVKRTP